MSPDVALVLALMMTPAPAKTAPPCGIVACKCGCAQGFPCTCRKGPPAINEAKYWKHQAELATKPKEVAAPAPQTFRRVVQAITQAPSAGCVG